MSRPVPESAVTALALVLSYGGLAACEGEIGEPSQFVPGQGVTSPDGGTVTPVDTGTLGGPEFDPFSGGATTLGAICDASGASGRLVFTAETGGCGRHAELLSGATPSGDYGIFDAPVVDGPGVYEATGELCLDGECSPRTVRFEIDALDPSGAIGRWSVPLEGRTAAGPIQATRCSYDAFLPGRDPNLAPNLELTQVAVYQGVKVPLMEAGAEAPRALPVVEARPGLLRAFVEPQAGFLQSRITAELTLDQGGGRAPSVRRQALEIAIASREASRGTTFEFPLSANDIGPATSWSIALKGEQACSGIGADTSGARFPSSGTVDLDADRVGPLDVTLVPFRYNADGSGRLPDTSEPQLERYRQVLLGMFPVEAVNLTVREVVDLELTVTPASGSWGPVLQRLLSVRADDSPPPSTYYYGIFRPSEGGWSGTAGLAPLASAPDVTRRGGIGLGGTGQGSALTCAHELGHAGGRSHAPCGGAGNPDPNYPHEGGVIGVWGYDFISDTLKDPDASNDLMGYCGNDWISDYNYLALFDRYSFVNQTAPDRRGAPSRWRSVYLAADGGSVWDKEVTHAEAPYGEQLTEVRYFDRFGAPLADEAAVVVPLDHADGTIVWVPAAPEGTAWVELEGRTLLY